MHSIQQRLQDLRAAMARVGVQGLVVTSADPHLSEYLPARWQTRQWLSGFTGSMGTLVVTTAEAALFADSRYWVQAEREMAGTGIVLEKLTAAASTAHVEWLTTRLAPGSVVNVDGQTLALAAAQALESALARAGMTLRTDLDLADAIWPDRPELPVTPVYEHVLPWVSAPRSARLREVRAAMAQRGATHHLVSTLDDIAFITNLRGGDVEYNPVFLAHLLIAPDAATLFIGEGKVDAALTQALAADGIALAPYAAAASALASLPEEAVCLIDPRRVTLGLRSALPPRLRIIEAINPSTLQKSRKTETDAAHLREVMRQDGAAMCEFYAWFESALGRERITELTIDERLTAARAQRPHFVGLSFPTIAAFNANGAMPHYRATPESHAVIEGNGLLLIDSGGQYPGGTTDITRVWAIGEVSAAMKRDCTLVFKGMQALSRARFPRGTLAPMLDALARAPLWAEGLDYGHGTGHGVGYFLNVHEGPQSISKAVPDPAMAMEAGMVTSNEPGLYRPGQWGVRIENLVLNREAATPEAGAFGEMLEFETLTLCPIDTRCLELSLLRPDELAWLNDYHAMVRERLAPLLEGAALAWLEHRTRRLAA
ncbi:MAG: hypothetical protein RL434_3049 [Pseudomonadota bacterium]|jgi:Xaa-Pro aminopeptidase